MTGPPSRLDNKVHKAILQVIEDSSIDNSDSLEDICLSQPKFFQVFGARGEEHRRLVKFQLQNYKTTEYQTNWKDDRMTEWQNDDKMTQWQNDKNDKMAKWKMTDHSPSPLLLALFFCSVLYDVFC